jgi:hypothetical protein
VEWQNKTSVAGAYPWPLCGAWVKALAAAAPPAAFDGGNDQGRSELLANLQTAQRRGRARALRRAQGRRESRLDGAERCVVGGRDARTAYLKKRSVVFWQRALADVERLKCTLGGPRACRFQQNRRARLVRPTVVKRTPWDRLRMTKVKALTHVRYSTALQEFRAWARARGKKLSPAGVCDKLTCLFLIALFEDGYGVWRGRNVVCGFQFLNWESGSKKD